VAIVASAASLSTRFRGARCALQIREIGRPCNDLAKNRQWPAVTVADCAITDPSFRTCTI
jgi:hypothetical protein